MIGGRGLARCLLVLLASLGEVATFTPAFSVPCGKRFRIMTHEAPPFINVDPALCVNQRCPAAAFGDDGGLTYNFVTKELKVQLEAQCVDAGEDAIIEFEWYLPPSDRSSAAGAVNLVCNGDFATNGVAKLLNGTTCPSATPGHANFYNGPSPKGTCSSIGDAACLSTGPDMVIGAVHIVVDRVAILQFSAPFMTVQQVTVKREEPDPDLLETMTGFLGPFNANLWGAIGLECVFMWIFFLIVETTVNEDIAEGWHAYFDTWYWVVSTLACGADKAPATMGGKIIFVAHALFTLIIIATYTGAVAAYLTVQASAEVIVGFESLKGGAFSTVVRGPSWNSEAADPVYKGKYLGGNAGNGTIASNQFKYFQALQESSSKISFKMMTTQRMDSRDASGAPLRFTSTVDPCVAAGAELGAYDMVACATAEEDPRSLVFDAPSVYFELNRIKKETGMCKLFTVGPEFNPTGYGIGFPYKTALHLPFSQAILTQKELGVFETYADQYNIGSSESQCTWNPKGLEMTLTEMSGIFILVGLVFFVGFTWGWLERNWYFHPAGETTDADREAALEKEAEGDKELVAVKEDIDFKDDEAVAVAGKVEDDAEGPDGVGSQLDELQDQMDRIEDLGRQLLALRGEAKGARGSNGDAAVAEKTPLQHVMSVFGQDASK